MQGECYICKKKGRIYCDDIHTCPYYCDNPECHKKAIEIMDKYSAELDKAREEYYLGEKREQIFKQINDERNKQLEKWGIRGAQDIYLWLSILTEEIGECHQAALQMNYESGKKTREDLKKELIQSAAVCCAILEEYFED